jgi:hypothetical protein
MEVTLVALDVEAPDIETAMLEEGFGNLEEGANLVGALGVDGCLEEVAALHMPSDSDNVVAKLTLELVGFFAVQLVEGECLVGFVNISEGIVTGDGVAAGGYMALIDGLLIDYKYLLTVDGGERGSFRVRKFECLRVGVFRLSC